MKEAINKKSATGVTILKTNNFATIQKVCLDTQTNLRMSAIIGDPGLGKTTALMHYLNNYQNVTYVTVKKSMTPQQFYLELIQRLGEMDQNKDIPLHFLIKKVSYILNKSENNNLLILDEAGKFSATMLEYLHELRDGTLNSTGIVLAGPEYFEKNMRKWVTKEIQGIPELHTRINYWQQLTSPTKAENKAICEAHGVNDPGIIRELANCKNFRSLMNEITRIKMIKEEELSNSD